MTLATQDRQYRSPSMRARVLGPLMYVRDLALDVLPAGTTFRFWRDDEAEGWFDDPTAVGDTLLVCTTSCTRGSLPAADFVSSLPADATARVVLDCCECDLADSVSDSAQLPLDGDLAEQVAWSSMVLANAFTLVAVSALRGVTVDNLPAEYRPGRLNAIFAAVFADHPELELLARQRFTTLAPGLLAAHQERALRLVPLPDLAGRRSRELAAAVTLRELTGSTAAFPSHPTDGSTWVFLASSAYITSQPAAACAALMAARHHVFLPAGEGLGLDRIGVAVLIPTGAAAAFENVFRAPARPGDTVADLQLLRTVGEAALDDTQAAQAALAEAARTALAR